MRIADIISMRIDSYSPTTLWERFCGAESTSVRGLLVLNLQQNTYDYVDRYFYFDEEEALREYRRISALLNEYGNRPTPPCPNEPIVCVAAVARDAKDD